MINTVKDLVVRLNVEAEQLESIGCHEAACGVHSSIRVIQDELDDHSAIGNADSHRIEPLERLNTRLINALARQSTAMQRFNHYCKEGILSTSQFHQLVQSNKAIKIKIRLLPRCQVCNGAGNTKPLFYVYECDSCGGTGINLANTTELVHLQQAIIHGEFDLIEKLVAALFKCGLADADRAALSVANFYDNSANNLRLD
jgi:ribosomal protein L37AE/L43A